MLSFKLNKLKQQVAKSDYFAVNNNQRSKILIVMGLIFVMGIGYLWQVNGLATKGYQIKDLEVKASALRQENKKIELEITELRSTARLNSEVEKLGLVQVARVEYLTSTGTSVAINR